MSDERLYELEYRIDLADREKTNRLDRLEHATRTIRAALEAMRAGDDDTAAELLDELEERDPIRAPLSRPPESYRDFITDYRRAQTEEGDA